MNEDARGFVLHAVTTSARRKASAPNVACRAAPSRRDATCLGEASRAACAARGIASMDTDPRGLDYGTPPARQTRFSVTAFVCSAIVVAVLLLDLLLVIPKLDAVLRDYAAWTPAYTDWLYHFSRYVGRG